MYRYTIIVLMGALLFFNGCSSMNAIKDQQSSKKARVVIDIPSDVPLEKVKQALHEAIAYRSQSFKENENFLPDTLPDEADHPKRNNTFNSLSAFAGGSPKFESMAYDTSNAYYYIKGEEELNGLFHSKEMSYVGALYLAKSYYRVYLVVFYQEGSEGINGAISKMTANALIGAEGALPFIIQVKEKFLSIVPESKVISSTPPEIKEYRLNDMNLLSKKEH